MVDDLGQMVLNRTWRPQLATVGMAGYPEPVDAGNVLLPYTEAKISVRTPPTLDAKEAVKAIKKALESDPPMAPPSSSMRAKAARAAGTRRRWRRGWRRP